MQKEVLPALPGDSARLRSPPITRGAKAKLASNKPTSKTLASILPPYHSDSNDEDYEDDGALTPGSTKNKHVSRHEGASDSIHGTDSDDQLPRVGTDDQLPRADTSKTRGTKAKGKARIVSPEHIIESEDDMPVSSKCPAQSSSLSTQAKRPRVHWISSDTGVSSTSSSSAVEILEVPKPTSKARPVVVIPHSKAPARKKVRHEVNEDANAAPMKGMSNILVSIAGLTPIQLDPGQLKDSRAQRCASTGKS
jgi:hypothetical protein